MTTAQTGVDTGASDVTEQQPISGDRQAPGSIELFDRAAAPFGQHLTAAREQRGWSRADVAARLKLPAKLIARLESDDYEGLTEGVFLRGYLASYARLVGVPVEQARNVAAAHTQTAPLVATGAISRSRYLFDRYSVSATYLVLTAIIVVPAVWLATHGGLEQNLARTTPLDPPVIAAPVGEAPSAPSNDAAPASGTDAVATIGNERAALTPLQITPEQTPVIASMAPFASTSPVHTGPPPAPATSAPTAPVTAGSGAHRLSLTLSQPSWVEITTADGRKLEYGILAAGAERSYRADGPVSVRLGNAQGAQMHSDGAPVDLAPYQHGNVARVTLFGADGANHVDQ